MSRLGEAMSIFARNVREPSGNSPARMRSNRSTIFCKGAAAIRTLLARLGQSAADLTDLVRREVVHIRFSRLDELNGPLVELIEVVGSVVQAIPVVAQPPNTVLDGVDILSLFLRRIGVIEA